MKSFTDFLVNHNNPIFSPIKVFMKPNKEAIVVVHYLDIYFETQHNDPFEALNIFVEIRDKDKMGWRRTKNEDISENPKVVILFRTKLAAAAAAASCFFFLR